MVPYRTQSKEQGYVNPVNVQSVVLCRFTPVQYALE